jgi:hypothetical protein
MPLSVNPCSEILLPHKPRRLYIALFNLYSKQIFPNNSLLDKFLLIL